MRAVAFLCLLGLATAFRTNPTSDSTTNSTTNSTPHSPVEGPYGWGNVSTDNFEVCLVDQASCGCCLMQKQMNKMEMFFNMSLSELTKDLHAAQHELNTVRASRASFSVALGTSRYGPFADERVVIYQHAFLNIGDHYSTTEGVFVVPRAAVYSLSLTLFGDSGSAANVLNLGAKLMVNTRTVSWPRERNRQDQSDSSTVVIALQLYQNDRVYVVLPQRAFLTDHELHSNTFTGFPLYYTD